MKREDMTAAAKFRAVCAMCGKGQPRPTTAHTAAQWMHAHERTHRFATTPTTDPNGESR